MPSRRAQRRRRAASPKQRERRRRPVDRRPKAGGDSIFRPGLVWFAGLTAATVPMARLLRRLRVVAAMDRLTGGIFMVFGVGLAMAR